MRFGSFDWMLVFVWQEVNDFGVGLLCVFGKDSCDIGQEFVLPDWILFRMLLMFVGSC